MNTQNELAEYIRLRHDIHAHPEMAYQEFRTADLVAVKLEQLGLTVTRGIAGTGLVGLLDRGEGPFIGIRADMDALPIVEQTSASYCSVNHGVMHACGHDGHTATLLAAVDMISKLPNLNGKIAFIFQPAEENEGGAKRMVEEGLFELFPVEFVYGLHNMPGIPTNKVIAPVGHVSAAFATFDITIIGRGGHGAMPESTVDPLPASGALVSALNTIVSRNLSPQHGGVVTIGDISSQNSTHNVIPNQVVLKGSCRSFEQADSALIEQRITQICQGIGIAFNVDVQIIYEHRYPSVLNALTPTERLWEAVSADNSTITLEKEMQPLMGSEDFSFFAEQVPGCFFIVGNGESGTLHSPTYDFNDDALVTGANVWVSLVKTLLQRIA